MYSYEKPTVDLAPLEKEQIDNPDSFGAIGGMRIRVVPVIGTQPALFGMYAAITVLSDLAEKRFDPCKVEPISRSFASKQSDRLKMRDKKIFENIPENETFTAIADNNEVAYVIEQLWRCKSCYGHARVESRQVFEMTRFDRSKPAMPYNLLFLTRAEATAHDASTKTTGSVPAELTGTTAEPSKHMPDKETLLHVQQVLADEERRWMAQK